MGFSSLLCQTAQVSAAVRTNIDGRVEETWRTIGIIACRFTHPSTNTASIAPGADAAKADATVFAGPELLTLTVCTDLPVRLITTDPGIAGTYELLRPMRAYAGKTAEIHHCECEVRKVHLP